MKTHCAPLCILACLLLTAAVSVHADEVYSKTEAANRLYKQGRFEDALKLYEDALLLSPSDPKLKMNKGSALYRLGDLDGAQKDYEGALDAKDKKERATAHYNMGNILFRKGETMQRQGDMKAQEEYKAALDHFIRALDLQPSDRDAKWNLQLTHGRIKQMEQQQQQQQQQQDDNKDKQNKEQQQQNRQQEPQQNKEQQDNGQKDKDTDKGDKKESQEQKEQQQQNQNQDQKGKEQPQPQSSAEQSGEKMKKEEAERILELYADDADSLNKPMKQGQGKQNQPERDW